MGTFARGLAFGLKWQKEIDFAHDCTLKMYLALVLMYFETYIIFWDASRMLNQFT